MVDLAAEKLPPEHRGMGTSLILGAGDIGFLSGNVVWGQWIEVRGYDETLFVVAGCSFAVALIYGWSQRSIVLRWRTPGTEPPSDPAA
jgi:predicted MFS family arabinose efflux permease